MSRPAFAPPHPGEYLRDDVLPALELNVSETADKLGITRQTLHGIIRHENPRSVTPEMAVRLGKLTGTGARIWLNLQATYDLWHAERNIDTSGIPTLSAA